MIKKEYDKKYNDLGLRIYLLEFYAIITVEIEFKALKDRGLKNYLNIILSTCYPYLTKTGKDEYFSTFQDYSITKFKS